MVEQLSTSISWRVMELQTLQNSVKMDHAGLTGNRKQTHFLFSLRILNLPVRPRQGPFQHPSIQKTLQARFFYIRLIHSMRAEFISTPHS